MGQRKKGMDKRRARGVFVRRLEHRIHFSVGRPSDSCARADFLAYDGLQSVLRRACEALGYHRRILIPSQAPSSSDRTEGQQRIAESRLDQSSMIDAGKSAVAANPESGQPPNVATGTVSGHGVRVMQNTVVVFLSRGIGLVMAGAGSVMLTRALRSGTARRICGGLRVSSRCSACCTSFGIGPILTREAAQNREDAGSVMFTAMCLATGFAFATGGLAFAISPLLHLSGKLFPLLAIAAVEIFLLVPVNLSSVIFQVDQKQWYSSGFSIIRQAIFLAVVFTAYHPGAPLVLRDRGPACRGCRRSGD